MKLRSHLILLLTLLHCGQPSIAAGPAKIDGWKFSQKHNINGRQNIFICKKAVRIDNLDLGYSMIADATAGTVVLFNSNKKLRHTKRLNEFAHQLARPFMYASSDIPPVSGWKKNGITSAGNIKAEWYRTEEGTTFFAGNRKSGGFLAGPKREATETHDLLICRETGVAPVLSKFLSEFQCTPDIGGVPFELRTKYSDSKNVRVIFHTVGTSHDKFDSNTWSVPPQCKETSNESSVTSGDGSLLEEIVGQ